MTSWADPLKTVAPADCAKCGESMKNRPALWLRINHTLHKEGEAAATLDLNDALEEYHQNGHQ